MQTGLFIVSFFLVLWLASTGWLLVSLRSTRNRVTELQDKLNSLGASVSAICAGSSGVDERLSSLERQGQVLVQRQESLEGQQHQDRPYGEAIQRVHRGATEESLVKELGLSQSEASLVFMLHGLKHAS